MTRIRWARMVIPGLGLWAGLGCQPQAGGMGTATVSNSASGDSTASEGTTPAPSSTAMPETDDTVGDGTETTTDTTGPTNDWPDEPYMWRKPIRIHPGVDLEEFPVGLLIEEDSDLADNTQPGGADLAVMSADGVTPLPFELERFNGGSGRLTMWFDPGPLSGDRDTRVYLYYGHESPPAPPPTAQTWPDRFAGVWHMHIDEMAALDSVDPPHDAVAPSASATAGGVIGIAGPAAEFDGNDDTHVAGSPPELNFGTESFTVSLWVEQVDDEGFDSPVYKGAAGGGVSGYGFFLRSDSSWFGGINDAGDDPQYVTYGTFPALVGAWHHLTMVVDRDRGMLRGYLDGELVQEEAITVGSVDSAAALQFSTDIARFAGVLDEVRVQRAVADDDRVRAEYTNIRNPSAFYTVEPAQARP